VAGPIDPVGTAAILRDLDFPTVRGNHERTVLDPQSKDPVDRWTRAQLSDADLAWLGTIPPTISIVDDLFLCHGTPQNDADPWLDNWFTNRTTVLPDESDVARHAEGFDFAVLLCGHTHIPRVVRLADGRLIVNPGAVGLQLFYGAPDARYAVLERIKGRWSVSLRVVAYDHEGAARDAEANGFPAWRRALVSGWAGPQGLFGSVLEA
jgi:diadenosine tetraphosphatase ApaH/serine/threonine PP2A family protein phosphatase